MLRRPAAAEVHRAVGALREVARHMRAAAVIWPRDSTEMLSPKAVQRQGT